MSGHIGIVTTVHDPDDARLRHKLAATLAAGHRVTLVAREPAPLRPYAATGDVALVGLAGGRLRRGIGAAGHIMSRRYDAVVVPDPELLPFALAARVLRRRVVFDLHEDVAAQLRHKAWVWRPLRRPLAWLAVRMLRIAERAMPLTLAEDGYHRLLRRGHPVFPNYPRYEALPEPVPGDGSVVYVGDVSRQRGATDLVDACGRLDPAPALTFIGQVPQELAAHLRERARRAGVPLRLRGRLPYRVAWREAVACGVGVVPLRDLPNYTHSLPTKLLEYLAVGLPVIAADLPGVRRVAAGRPGVTLVPAGDIDAWVEAIGLVLGDGTAREEAAAHRGDVQRDFAWPDDEVAGFYAAFIDG